MQNTKTTLELARFSLGFMRFTLVLPNIVFLHYYLE
jgi:hypothetical protein